MNRKKIKNVITSLIVLTLTLMPRIASASTVTNSKVVTGTQALISDLMNALLVIVPVLTIVIVVFNIVKIQLAEDDQDVKPLKKKIKMTIIVGILAFLVSTLITIILSYYK